MSTDLSEEFFEALIDTTEVKLYFEDQKGSAWTEDLTAKRIGKRWIAQLDIKSDCRLVRSAYRVRGEWKIDTANWNFQAGMSVTFDLVF